MSDRKGHRTLWQVLGLYAAASWICLQVVDILAENIPLPSWVFMLTLILLLIGLPITAATAHLNTRRAQATEDKEEGSGFAQQLLTWQNVLRGGVAAMAIWGMAVTGWLLLGEDGLSGAEMMAEVQQIEMLLSQDQYSAAFVLAEEAERIIPGDEALEELWSRISRSVDLTTSPTEATLSVAFYSEQGDPEWRAIGESPASAVSLPREAVHLRIEKPGFEAIETLLAHRGTNFEFVLDEAGSIPSGMVRVREGDKRIQLAAFDDYPAASTPSYLIDKTEVTNSEFKQFIDAGGYRDAAYWNHAVFDDGEELSWETAIDHFRDRTGRVGPSTWEGGTYPIGEDDYPVSGVSWYEAAAYAEFRGRSLPSVYHWLGATSTGLATFVLPQSNFLGEGPRQVAASMPGPYGTYDMAGNVKEWCWNETGTNRFILGAAWNEPTYMFFEQDARPPLDRSENNGFRTADYLGAEAAVLEASMRPVNRVIRDYALESPASDELYQAYVAQFAYDPEPLNISAVSTDDSSPYWTREVVEFDAAYGGERMAAHLFVPRDVAAPYQTVIFLPGSNATRQTSSDQMGLAEIDLIVKSGRAVLWPVYKDTYERSTGLEFTDPNESRAYVEHVIWWIKDVKRSLDYLETRSDIDFDRIGYVGHSWGARIGNIALAVEPRLRVGILIAGGFPLMFSQPEVAEITFAARVSVPVLFITGTHDRVFPYETSQTPMFENLGTAESDKQWVIYDASHGVRVEFREQVFQEIQSWLDNYFGLVG